MRAASMSGRSPARADRWRGQSGGGLGQLEHRQDGDLLVTDRSQEIGGTDRRIPPEPIARASQR